MEYAYEEYLTFDERMAPLLNVEIPDDEQGNWDQEIKVIHFVVAQLKSKRIKINNEEIESTFNAKIMRIKQTSGHLFKIIGIRSEVELLRRLIENRFLRWYCSRAYPPTPREGGREGV